MDAFALFALLLPGVEPRTGQVTQLRALNTRYYTELYRLQEAARHESTRDAVPAEPDLTNIHASIASDIRSTLTEEERTVFDRNLTLLHDAIARRRV